MVLLRIALGLFAWMGLLYGALAIRLLPGDFGHAICGPWGCGPTLQSLVACHSFWVLLIGPPLWILAGRLSIGRVRFVATAMWLTATLGVTAICIWQASTWVPNYPGGSELAWKYFAQRCLFVVGTAVEIPLLPLAIASLPLIGRNILTRRSAVIGPQAAERMDRPSVPQPE